MYTDEEKAWLKAAEKYAHSNGHSFDFVVAGGWLEYKEEGYTPEGAVDEEISHGEC